MSLRISQLILFAFFFAAVPGLAAGAFQDPLDQAAELSPRAPDTSLCAVAHAGQRIVAVGQADMGIMLTFMFLWNMIGALILVPALSHFLLQTVKVTRASPNH